MRPGDFDMGVSGPRTPPMHGMTPTSTTLSEAEEMARKRAEFSRKEFYKNRKILIEDVPPVTYEEVKEFMGGYKIANINISRKTRNAYVILKHGEEAEEIVDVLRGKKLLDKEVLVSIKPNETLLCLAHLPFHLADHDLRKFACQFGIIEKCFLMRNERTGESKGYGLVEYTHNRDHTNTARLKIDGMEVDQCRVHCEFIQSHLTAFNDLHSKCLFINKLPADLVNERQLEELCRYEVELVFSKIGMKNDQPLGFAIIEFRTSADAELMQTRLHGHPVRENRTLSATFCVPGMSGPELYNKALNAVGTGRSAGSDVKALGLIPTPNMPPPFVNPNANNMNPGIRMGMRPPPPQVTQGLRNLFQQLQVMQQNMNQLMQGGPRPPNPTQPPPSSMGMGFLGPGPNMLPPANPMMQQAITLLAASLQSQQQQQQLMMGLNGLQMLIQQQNNMGPSRLPPAQQALLGNPIMLQTNNFLQALVSQLQRQQQASTQPPQEQHPPPVNRSNNQENRHLPPNQGSGMMPQNHNNMRGPNPNSNMMQHPTTSQGLQGQRQNSQPPPQFQVQNQNALNNLQQLFMNLQKGGVGGNGGPNQMQQQPRQTQPNPQNQPRPNNIPQNQGQALLQTILSSVMNSIMNLGNKGQNHEGPRDMDHRRHSPERLGRERERSHSERSHHSRGALSNSSRPRHASTSRVGEMEDGAIQRLYGHNEGDHGSRRGSQDPLSKPPLQGQGGYQHDGRHEAERRERPPERELKQGDNGQLAITINQEAATNKGQGDGYSQSYVYTTEKSTVPDGYVDQQYPSTSSSGQPPQEGQQGLFDQNYYMCNDYNNYMTQLQIPHQTPSTSSSSQSSPTSQGGPPSQEWVGQQQQVQQQPIGARKPKTTVERSHASGSNSDTAASGQKGPDGVMQAVQQIMAQSLSSGVSQNQTASTAGSSTPVNPLKRPATCLVPGPEPSPEGEYVGQHSQGLGGHYSASYVKRKRLL